MLLATLMAPVLGVITYIAVGKFVGEQPQAAQSGKSYILVEKPNCRYNSGLCGLKNVDFELTLSFERLQGQRILLKMESEHPLDGVMLAQVVNEGDETQPKPMRSVSPDGLNWSMEISNPDPENQRLHLVASSNETLYLGDVALKFTSNEITSK